MASIFKFTYSLKHEFFTVGDFQTALSSLKQVFAWELHFHFSPTLTFQIDIFATMNHVLFRSLGYCETDQHEGQQTNQHEVRLLPQT